MAHGCGFLTAHFLQSSPEHLVLVHHRFRQLAVVVLTLKVRIEPVQLVRGYVVALVADASELGRTHAVLALVPPVGSVRVVSARHCQAGGEQAKCG